MTWEIKQLLNGQLFQEYLDRKLLKSDNLASCYNKKMPAMFLEHSVLLPLSLFVVKLLSVVLFIILFHNPTYKHRSPDTGAEPREEKCEIAKWADINQV